MLPFLLEDYLGAVWVFLEAGSKEPGKMFLTLGALLNAASSIELTLWSGRNLGSLNPGGAPR